METHRAPMCFDCVRYRGRDERGRALATPTCEAFPRGIPVGIWDDAGDHRIPWSGDGGLTFMARNQAALDRVAMFWDA
ncbi:MAG: hypothetical protein WEB00_14525 [Dehalococcoidia bacterium]